MTKAKRIFGVIFASILLLMSVVFYAYMIMLEKIPLVMII